MSIRIPEMKKHKATGQAYINTNGTRIYLGKHGTSHANERYKLAIKLVLNNAPVARIKSDVSSRSHLTLFSLMKQARIAGGRNSGYWVAAERMLERSGLGEISAESLTPMLFESFLSNCCSYKKKNGTSYSIQTISRIAACIKDSYRYAAKSEILPPEMWWKLKSCEVPAVGVREAKPRRDVKPLPLEDFERTIEHVRGHWKDVLLILRYTGMRPGEALSLSWACVDDSGSVWVYAPSEHKTRHKGRERLIYLGPKCQRILIRYRNRDPVFGINYSDVNYHAQRLRREITRASRLAGVGDWFPYRLRHLRLTEIRKQFGLDAAQAIGGHSELSTTQVYAERQDELGRKAAAMSG